MGKCVDMLPNFSGLQTVTQYTYLSFVRTFVTIYTCTVCTVMLTSTCIGWVTYVLVYFSSGEFFYIEVDDLLPDHND